MPEAVTFDHYEVLTRDDGTLYELGRGAMGITYKAYDTNLRVPVALKVINETYLDSEVARQRFVREARSAAKLRHRNVATVYHLGTSEKAWFYAMEFVDGETLGALIKRQGPIAPQLALEITDQVARALNAAQQQGLVHRDIKPANLMLVREDDELVVKVIDFGLAKASAAGGDEDAATVSMGGFVGTPHFASPEQLEEKEIDVRSDIYSLGVTLWYMLAGQAPFAGSMAQVMSQQLSKPPPFEKLPDLPGPLSGVLRKMLEKDPANRYQTPLDLRRDVEAASAALDAAPASAQGASQDEENFATLLEDVSSRAGDSAWETGARIAGRYRIVESRGETNSGEIFRAHDHQAGRDVRLLRLKPDLIENSAIAAEIEREVERIAPVEHANLLRIHSFETVSGASYLTLEWTDGFTLLELLRARRELQPAEALAILQQAAAGADAALAAGLDRIDFALNHVRFHFAEPIEKEVLMRLPVEQWPAFTVKLNPLGITRDLSASQTWAGAQTMVGGAGPRTIGGIDTRARFIRALASITYEMLGGTPATRSYTPLATLSEEGNAVLRRALDPAASYPSAENFHRALAAIDGLDLRRHPARPAPAPKKSSPPPVVPPPLPRQSSSSPVARRKFPFAFFSGVLTVSAIGAAVYIFKNGDEAAKVPAHPGRGDPIEIAENPVTPPAETPPSTTPAPLAAATPIPVPPMPDPPTPSRKELLDKAIHEAEAVEAREAWPEALAAYLQIVREYPESETGRVHLELMLGRMIKMPKGLPPDAFAAMREGLEAAAKMDIVAAMTLLADSLRERDPVSSFQWMNSAAQRGNIDALTQVGLMYSNGFGTPKDLVKAVESFRAAAEKGDAPAKSALAECYLLGKGTPRSDEKAIELLREAVSQGDLRAMNMLGDCYHKGVGVPKPEYSEAFRLFSKASERGLPVAMLNLGVMHMNGQGTKEDFRKGVECFQKAATAGEAHGMFLLAQCLENGTGIGVNKLQAQTWYRKAAESGHKKAAEWCRSHGVPFRESN